MMRRCARTLCRRVLPDKTVLDGTFVKDRLVSGIALLPDGRKFTGQFDEATGVPLPETTLEEDGDVYQGTFNEMWQRHGEGAAILRDGTRYAGRFHGDELVHGIVRIPDPAGEMVFTGDLRDEQFVKGKLEHRDYVYEGEFTANQPHGRGVLRMTSGAVHEGTFFRGQLHGANCKLRLESGHLYTGEFNGGRIRSGELRTPTFTYEGDFNEQGMAEGEGRAEYLTMDPRIIFTGRWVAGSMTEGSVADEFGTPVDFHNNPELRKEVHGVTDADLAVDAEARETLRDSQQRFREMQSGFVRDAERTRDATGRAVDKVDLGYELGVKAEQDWQHRVHREQAMRQQAARQVPPELGAEVRAQMETIGAMRQQPGFEEVDVTVAQTAALHQRGAQKVIAERATKQFEAYLEKQQQQSPSDEETNKPKLEIDGNPAWKTVMR
jgi:hypothetical protein